MSQHCFSSPLCFSVLLAWSDVKRFAEEAKSDSKPHSFEDFRVVRLRDILVK